MRKWLPLAPPNMPGVWFDVSNMIPDRAGAYHPYNIFTQKVGAGPSTPGTTLRAWCALLPSETAVCFVGTTTKLYELSGTTFTDRSKGGGYTNTATDWSFGQYGNITLATNRVDAIQVRDSSGSSAFADLAGSPPKARIIVTQADQILLFDLNDGAEKPDAFATSAPGDHTDWSSTGATTATRIRHRPGGIRAAIAYRDYVLVFKQNSVYRLTYTGGTFKWRVELIAIGRGAWGMHDVLNCGDVVVFSGPGGAWSYDGASFRELTEFLGEVTGTGGGSGLGSCVGSFYCPLAQNAFFWRDNNKASAYNLVSDRWGNVDNPTMASATLTNAYRPLTGEPAAMLSFMAPAVPARTPELVWLFNLSSSSNSVVKSDSFWGNGALNNSAYLISGMEGAGGEQITKFKRFRPVTTNTTWVPTGDITPSATELLLSIYTGSSMDARNLNPSAVGATITQIDIASSTAQRRFDFLQSSVFARFKLFIPDSSGYIEVQDYEVVAEPAGSL